MPKDTTGARQFRKGTKSCIECRQRKLKCDGYTPCANCRSHGRDCVLQTEMTRGSGDAFKTTSRDRISHLEDEVGSLWAVVKELRAELGHKDSETPQQEIKSTFIGSRLTADTDAESVDSQEDTPGNAPAHLQQLFDGGVFDHEPTSVSPHMDMTETISPAALASATKRLQALMPPKHDVQVLAEYSNVWMSLYNELFPTASLYKSSQELLAKYETVQNPQAHPCAVAVCLLAIAITAQQTPAQVTSKLQGIKDLQAFPREISTVVEQIIVADNALGGTMEGIEATLLFLRIQLVRARIKKVWLLLRRIIALAELIGLPRAASSIRSLPNPDQASQKQREAAQLWQSICVTDRVSGMMLSLPCGTAAYPFPRPEVVFSSDGKPVPNALFSALAGIAQQVLEIDDLHISGADDAVIFQKVLATDAELRSISNMAPAEWWSMPTSQLSVDHVLQYWHQYFTIRTHLATAMKSSQSAQYAYSRSVTTEASRSVGFRYTQLRSKLPPGFFAGRILDLQALTATVFLLHSIYSQNATEQPTLGSTSAEDLDLVKKVTTQMQEAGKQLSGDVARQGSKALKSMLDHFANPQAMGSRTLTLRVPMLGKVHINRKPVRQPMPTPGINFNATQTSQQQQQQQQQTNGAEIPGYFVPQQDQNGVKGQQFGGPTTDVDMANSMGWSMDLMGDFPFMADDPYSSGDSWLWFNDWTTPPQPS